MGYLERRNEEIAHSDEWLKPSLELDDPTEEEEIEEDEDGPSEEEMDEALAEEDEGNPSEEEMDEANEEDEDEGQE